MSQISQLSISLSVHRPLLPVIHPPLSLPQLPVPQQPNLLLGHFRDKSLFLPFLLAPDTKQTCSRKSVEDIIYPKSGFGRGSGPSTREVGRERTSTNSDSTRFQRQDASDASDESWQTLNFMQMSIGATTATANWGLIWIPKAEKGGNACCLIDLPMVALVASVAATGDCSDAMWATRATTGDFIAFGVSTQLRWGWGWALQWLVLVRTWLWWLRWTMLGGICKVFTKLFVQGIIVVQTNATLHTLEPRSSHVESLRSVWSWSTEIFEAQKHIHTDRQTDRQRFLAFIERCGL